MIKEKILAELGRHKTLPNAGLVADNISLDVDETSEQLSDSEDGLSVGYKTAERFQIRGFHDTLSHEPRGIHRRDLAGTVKTCMTRDEWIKSVVDSCRPKKKFTRKTKSCDPNHPDYNIFQKKWKYKKPNVTSPLKEYILGESNRFQDVQTPKFKSPPRTLVQKFNLIKYLYGGHANEELGHEKEKKVKRNLLEDLQAIRDKERCERKQKRHQRLAFLKIPFKTKSESAISKNTKPESEDWVPSLEPIESTICREGRKDETNMQAPNYREPTLRNHPRRQRAYDGRTDAELPRMQKLSPERYQEANLEEPKNEMGWNGRRHHDHKEHTQKRMVRVKYVTKTEEFPKYNDEIEKKDKFKLSLPGLKTPTCDWSRVANEHERTNDQEEVKLKMEMGESDVGSDPDATPASEFQKFMNEKFKEHVVIAAGGKEELAYEYPEAESYRQKILGEQESVQSCLTSKSSSECTNFSNDSGSFFVFFNKKVPLDFFTKSEVPFKRGHENHMEAQIVTPRDEYYGPYFAVPYAGQGIEMRQMCRPKDRVYTQQTRARVGIRERLYIPPPDLQQVGKKGKKKYEPRCG